MIRYEKISLNHHLILLVSSGTQCAPLKLQELPHCDKQTSWPADTRHINLLAQEPEILTKRLVILILVTKHAYALGKPYCFYSA